VIAWRNQRSARRDTGAGELARRGDAVACADEAGEHARRADFGVEAELEAHILHGVVVVVHPDGVQDLGIEGEVVGAVAGFQQRIDVEDERDPAGVVVADEGEEIGDVRLVIERGERRFAMVGGLSASGDGQGQGQTETSAGKRAGHGVPPRQMVR
jgi:hypothetical protein